MGKELGNTIVPIVPIKRNPTQWRKLTSNSLSLSAFRHEMGYGMIRWEKVCVLLWRQKINSSFLSWRNLRPYCFLVDFSSSCITKFRITGKTHVKSGVCLESHQIPMRKISHNTIMPLAHAKHYWTWINIALALGARTYITDTLYTY